MQLLSSARKQEWLKPDQIPWEWKFNQESGGTALYILSIKWLIGSSQVGDHEMYQK